MLDNLTTVGRDRRIVAAILLAGMLLGTTGPAALLGPHAASPIALGVIRLQLGGLLIVAVLPALGGSRMNVLRLWRRPTVLVMSAALGLYQTLFLSAVSLAGVAFGTLVAVGSAPVWTGLIAWAALREKPSREWLVATTIAVAGLVLRASGHLDGPDLRGLVLAIVCGLLTGSYGVAGKVELGRGTIPIELPAAAGLLGGIVFAPALLAVPLGWVASTEGFVLLLYLGIFTMALANILHILGLHRLQPGPVATLMLTAPLTATVIGVLVFGESLTPASAIGAALVLLGIALQGRATAQDEATQLESTPTM